MWNTIGGLRSPSLQRQSKFQDGEYEMTDNQQFPSPVSQSAYPPAAYGNFPPPPKKSANKIWVWVVIGIGVFCVCCAGLCIAGFALLVRSDIVERGPVSSVLDSYMKFMVAKDVTSAYALFSPHAQSQFPISNLQALVEGNNYLVFEGYQGLSFTSFAISVGFYTNTNQPQGEYAKVAGNISYQGGFQGMFNGTLEKVGGKWKLYGISVTAPPDKFKP
jgi:hypothetical protein